MRRLLLRRATTPLHSHSHSHSRPDADTLIRAKDIQSIITDRQTDNDCIFAGSSSPPCAARRHSASDSCLYGRRRSTLFGRASSLFLWVLQLDSTPLQHCNLTRLAVSHLMAALALHLDSMCRHSDKSSTLVVFLPQRADFAHSSLLNFA